VSVAVEPMRVAIKNLVTNALDATPRGAGDVTVRARRRGQDLVIEVQDEGPGIPRANLDDVFVPFFTTKGPGEGAGLGLPIAASIVRQHEGTLEVSSPPGHGARFVVTLPLTASGRAL
jgi:signal transduction histidine kinase